MVGLLELVARTFALLGAGNSGSIVIPALMVFGFIGAVSAATVLIAVILHVRVTLRPRTGPVELREVENLRVLVTHNNPDAPGHVRSRAPGSAIVTVRTAGFSVQ